MSPTSQPGLLRRFFRWLFSPSAKWSVFALLLLGVVLGFGATVGTQVGVAWSSTNEFCGTSCHSHVQFVYPEYKKSAHGHNRVGVNAGCTDCHVPHSYPEKLIYKARVGVRDLIAEYRGTISTKEKFEARRWELANHVWDEMRANNSANCRTCHNPETWDTSKQSEDAVKAHKKFTSGKATCIDCHTGMAHAEPEEPDNAGKADKAKDDTQPAATPAEQAASGAKG